MASLALPPPNPPAVAATSSSSSKPATTMKRGSIANGTATAVGGKERSITPDEDEEEEEEEEDEPRKKKKKGKSGGATGEYKYQSEIAAMMFVFGEVQEPLPETIKLVEDVVRGQIIEIVTRARLLTHLRSSRALSAEDLIFLIREDRGKVNRLRTYLSWKDVRKKAKEDDAGPGGADVDVELDGAGDGGDRSTMKGRKTMIKLPWELMTPYSEYLRGLPISLNKEEDEEEDEDEIQAHQDSMQRLRDADEITKKMTKDEYVHYSDCRQASFTYRKARRFREFINFAAYLDVRPNDDIIDILGFLAFEMVRSLCVTALDVRARHEEPLHRPAPTNTTSGGGGGGGADSPVKRKNTAGTGNKGETTSPNKRPRSEISPPSARVPLPLFAAPPSARQPLTPAHVLEAYAQIQRQQAASRVGGMRNFRGSITKGRMALV